jgi:hypothetical protein
MSDLRAGAESPRRNGARRRPRFGSVDLEEIQAELLRPFAAEAVEFIVQATFGGPPQRPTRALVVPYLQKVAVTERLDGVVGPAGWEAIYTPVGADALLCRLELCGLARESHGQGRDRWSQEANALKRAAREFGLGRYLTKMRPVICPIGQGPEQVQRRGRGHVVPEGLVAVLRAGYLRRVERTYVALYGEIVSVEGLEGASGEEGELSAAEQRGEPAAGNGSVPTMVAETSGPGTDRGSVGAPAAAVAAVREAYKGAGLTKRHAEAISGLLFGQRIYERLDSVPALELAGQLRRIGGARISRKRLERCLEAAKEEPEREAAAERFRGWVGEELTKGNGGQAADAEPGA